MVGHVRQGPLKLYDVMKRANVVNEGISNFSEPSSRMRCFYCGLYRCALSLKVKQHSPQLPATLSATNGGDRKTNNVESTRSLN